MISTEIFLVFVLIIVLILLFVSISQCDKTGRGITGGDGIFDSLKNVATSVKDKIISVPKMVQNRFSSDKAKQTEYEYGVWAKKAQNEAKNVGEREMTNTSSITEQPINTQKTNQSTTHQYMPLIRKNDNNYGSVDLCPMTKNKIKTKLDDMNCDNTNKKTIQDIAKILDI